MHELSIAMSIVEMARGRSRATRRASHAVHLKLGALSGVVKEALLFSYEMACEGTLLAGSRLVVEDVPIVVFCPNCQARAPVSSMQWFCCPECGTPTRRLCKGKNSKSLHWRLKQ